jgi:hypothetical protein
LHDELYPLVYQHLVERKRLVIARIVMEDVHQMILSILSDEKKIFTNCPIDHDNHTSIELIENIIVQVIPIHAHLAQFLLPIGQILNNNRIFCVVRIRSRSFVNERYKNNRRFNNDKYTINCLPMGPPQGAMATIGLRRTLFLASRNVDE